MYNSSSSYQMPFFQEKNCDDLHFWWHAKKPRFPLAQFSTFFPAMNKQKYCKARSRMAVQKTIFPRICVVKEWHNELFEPAAHIVGHCSPELVTLLLAPCSPCSQGQWILSKSLFGKLIWIGTRASPWLAMARVLCSQSYLLTGTP